VPKRRARGQITVEMAVVFPLLIMVAMGLVQFALYYHAHNVVEAAVQEGVRVAAAHGATTGDGKARAQAVLRAGMGRSSVVDIQTPAAGPDRVTLVAKGSMRTFIPWFSFRSGVTNLRLPLDATASATKERFRDYQ
jgi:Flp pilus assembly protein TadG